MNRIKLLREEMRMTQVKLSTELGVSQETVSAYESGKHYPSIPNLLKMSELFSCKLRLYSWHFRYTNNNDRNRRRR